MTATATAPTRHAPHCPATDAHVERVDATLVARCRSCGATESRPETYAELIERTLAAIDRLDTLVQQYGRQARAAL